MKKVMTGEGFLTFPLLEQDAIGTYFSPFLGTEEDSGSGIGRRKRKCRVEVL